MNNYIGINLLIVIMIIMLLILIFFNINKLIISRNNNFDMKLNKNLDEITEEIDILNEDTDERVMDEKSDIDNKDVVSYFEVIDSVVIVHSNFII